MKLTHAFLALGAVGMACGCGSKDQNAASGGAKQAAAVGDLTMDNVMPMANGNVWTYALSAKSLQGSGTAEAVFKMRDVQDLGGGGKRAKIDIFLNQKLTETQIWELDASGLYEVAGGEHTTPFSTRQPMVLFPAKKGSKFKWEGKGPMPVGGNNSAKLESEVHGPELIDTATGLTGAVGVETTGTFIVTLKQPGKGSQDAQAVQVSDSWWQPKVGLVRMKIKITVPGVREDEQTIKLKKFSPVGKG